MTTRSKMKLVFNVGLVITSVLFVATLVYFDNDAKSAFLFVLNVIHTVAYVDTMSGLIRDINTENSKQ